MRHTRPVKRIKNTGTPTRELLPLLRCRNWLVSPLAWASFQGCTPFLASGDGVYSFVLSLTHSFESLINQNNRMIKWSKGRRRMSCRWWLSMKLAVALTLSLHVDDLLKENPGLALVPLAPRQRSWRLLGVFRQLAAFALLQLYLSVALLWQGGSLFYLRFPIWIIFKRVVLKYFVKTNLVQVLETSLGGHVEATLYLTINHFRFIKFTRSNTKQGVLVWALFCLNITHHKSDLLFFCLN